MKKQSTYHERGQALILIVFAAIGLFAFTALAIDGGRVFSDRRHSQNASDTAVLAGALERIRQHSGVNWEDVAKQRAADNGYSNNAETEVDTYLCSDLPKTAPDGYVMTCKGLPTGLDPSKYSEYIYVHIKSVVHLYFAPVIGWRTVTNHTDAVVHAGIPVPTTWFDGYGITSTHKGCTSPGDSDPFELDGNTSNYVLGSGVLINASCPGKDSFVQNGNPTLFTTTGVCVHGTADYDPTDITSDASPSLKQNCDPIDPASYQLPDDPTCDKDGFLEPQGGNVWIAQPGNYTSNKPFPDVSGSATVILTKGIYCLYHGMKVNAQTTITTDWKKNGAFDPDVEGVLFYLPGTASDDDIFFSGGANINVHAISSKPGSWFKDQWLNLLIYVKPSPGYDPDIDISGNAGSTFTGTILAPAAHVILGGTPSTDAGTFELDSQIIADTVKLAGNSQFTLIYNEENNATTLTNPDMSVIE